MRLCGRRAVLGLGGAFALVTTGAAQPRADQPAPPSGGPTLEVVVVTAIGQSFTLGPRRTANGAPPNAEVRVGWRPRRARWAVAELGLGATVFPELVPTLGLGLRLHPLVDRAYVRHLFARVGASALIVVDGFDLAVGGEAGVAIARQRVVGWIGLGADRFVIQPRLVVQGRVGVGVTF